MDDRAAGHVATAMRLEGFAGRVALVTGAGRGIGRRIAETFAALGATTVAADLEAPDLPGIHGIAFDVADELAVDAAFAAIEAEHGHVEILVLNAGILVVEPLAETTHDSWRRTLGINLDGAFLCTRRALPRMRQGGYGRMVALGSSAGISGGSVPCAAYAASKAGLMALMKAVAQEASGDGVTANAVAPALIRTPMMARHRAPGRPRAGRARRRARRRGRLHRVPLLGPRLLHHGRDPRRQRRLPHRLSATMRAMELPPLGAPLGLVRRPVPEPGPGRGARARAGLRRLRLRPLPPERRLRPARCRSCPGTRRPASSTRSAPASTDVPVGRSGRPLLHLDAAGRSLGGGGRPEPQPGRERMGVDVDGAFAEYVLRPRASLIVPPAPLPSPELAVITDAVATPLHALRRIAKLQAGETVAVIGVGGHRLERRAARPRLGATVIADQPLRRRSSTSRRARAAHARALRRARRRPRAGADGRRGRRRRAAVRGLRGGLRDVARRCGPGGRIVLVGSSADRSASRRCRSSGRELSLLGSRGFVQGTSRRRSSCASTAGSRSTTSCRRVRPLEEAQRRARRPRAGACCAPCSCHERPAARRDPRPRTGSSGSRARASDLRATAWRRRARSRRRCSARSRWSPPRARRADGRGRRRSASARRRARRDARRAGHGGAARVHDARRSTPCPPRRSSSGAAPRRTRAPRRTTTTPTSPPRARRSARPS